MSSDISLTDLLPKSMHSMYMMGYNLNHYASPPMQQDSTDAHANRTAESFIAYTYNGMTHGRGAASLIVFPRLSHSVLGIITWAYILLLLIQAGQRPYHLAAQMFQQIQSRRRGKGHTIRRQYLNAWKRPRGLGLGLLAYHPLAWR